MEGVSGRVDAVHHSWRVKERRGGFVELLQTVRSIPSQVGRQEVTGSLTRGLL